jgi:O-acetyl-ADP-ribose deacetylase (regulator of RNase III)
MGAGLAKVFKIKYPTHYKQYKNICDRNLLTIGKLFYTQINDHTGILGFPTKDQWKYPSKLEYIHRGFKALLLNKHRFVNKDIAFPLLGCGKGGLSYQDVLPVMVKYLNHLPSNSTYYIVLPEHS